MQAAVCERETNASFSLRARDWCRRQCASERPAPVAVCSKCAGRPVPAHCEIGLCAYILLVCVHASKQTNTRTRSQTYTRTSTRAHLHSDKYKTRGYGICQPMLTGRAWYVLLSWPGEYCGTSGYLQLLCARMCTVQGCRKSHRHHICKPASECEMSRRANKSLAASLALSLCCGCERILLVGEQAKVPVRLIDRNGARDRKIQSST